MEKHFKKEDRKEQGEKITCDEVSQAAEKGICRCILAADSPRALWGGTPPPAVIAARNRGPYCRPSLDVDAGWLVPCITCFPGLDLKVGMMWAGCLASLWGLCGVLAVPQPGEICNPSTGELRLKFTGQSGPQLTGSRTCHWIQIFLDSRLTSKYSKWGDFLKRHRWVSIKCWCFSWSSDTSSRASAAPLPTLHRVVSPEIWVSKKCILDLFFSHYE